jgi:HSP20 family protein
MATETKSPPATQKMEVTRRDPMGLFPPPFGFLRRFSEDVDRMFESFLGVRRPLAPVPARLTPEAVWAPAIEMLEKNGQLIVRAELPGLTKEDVEIEITEDMLTLKGERREEKEEKGEGFYRTERCYGSFFRTLPLPEGAETDKAKAAFHDGVLEIMMPAPVMERPKSRHVQIEEAPPVKGKTAA